MPVPVLAAGCGGHRPFAAGTDNGLGKCAFFKTVIFDGALPRKTFSMGEANEKRYYLECRKISK